VTANDRRGCLSIRARRDTPPRARPAMSEPQRELRKLIATKTRPQRAGRTTPRRRERSSSSNIRDRARRSARRAARGAGEPAAGAGLTRAGGYRQGRAQADARERARRVHAAARPARPLHTTRRELRRRCPPVGAASSADARGVARRRARRQASRRRRPLSSMERSGRLSTPVGSCCWAIATSRQSAGPQLPSGSQAALRETDVLRNGYVSEVEWGARRSRVRLHRPGRPHDSSVHGRRG
jgi:hypothetical protein